MKITPTVLAPHKGCYMCGKQCKFRGLCVTPDSDNANQKDEKGYSKYVAKHDRYGCNTSKRD